MMLYAIVVCGLLAVETSIDSDSVKAIFSRRAGCSVDRESSCPFELRRLLCWR